MQASFAFAGAIIITAIMASLSSAYARAGQPAVPNAGVITPTAPVVPPYLRDPWKSYERNPYFGRYRVEQQSFRQVPCSQTRIAFGPGGKCLQGYRLGIAPFTGWRGSSNLCDLALDVVIDTTGRLSIQADILVFDPYKVTGSGGAQPRYCYVRSYLGYYQEDFQDMNQVTGEEPTGIIWSSMSRTAKNDPSNSRKEATAVLPF